MRGSMNIIMVSIKDIKNEGLQRFIKYHLLYLARSKVDEIKDNIIFNLLKFDPNKKSIFNINAIKGNRKIPW